MMITKIISGGQTGADRAALDVALKMDIVHGGWIPKGRLTEAGRLPAEYSLKEMPSASYPRRTEQNVVDSDGTLILSHGRLEGGSAYTRKMAEQHDRPWLHIDLNQTSAFDAAGRIRNWTSEYQIRILNVAGSRASKDPQIYRATMNILEAAIYLDQMDMPGLDTDRADSSSPARNHHPSSYPQTVDEAVTRLITQMPLKDKITIANMTLDELSSLHLSLGAYIRNEFGLWSGNSDLLASCRFSSHRDQLDENQASIWIIRTLWDKLRQTHRLRVLK